MKLTREKFGTTKEGKQVDIFEIDNGWMSIKVMTYGATLVSAVMPDKFGEKEEITLGFDTFEQWEQPHPYLGATIGRFGNRIAKSKFTIDGTEYKVTPSEGKHHLHGGMKGFDKVMWEPFPFKLDTEAGVKFCYTSPDGEEGYPGTLDVAAIISLTADNRIVFEYKASTDKKTPVNLTNHTYWNLRNKGTVYDHVLSLNADTLLDVDKELIPTGTLLPVKNTPFDFTQPVRIGDVIEEAGGFDHCYVINRDDEKDLQECATLIEESRGRVMKISTNQPGVQFYSANGLTNELQGRRVFGKHGALCLETQGFPDAVNHENFPSAILEPGDEYHHLTIHEFSVKE